MEIRERQGHFPANQNRKITLANQKSKRRKPKIRPIPQLLFRPSIFAAKQQKDSDIAHVIIIQNMRRGVAPECLQTSSCIFLGQASIEYFHLHTIAIIGAKEILHILRHEEIAVI